MREQLEEETAAVHAERHVASEKQRSRVGRRAARAESGQRPLRVRIRGLQAQAAKLAARWLEEEHQPARETASIGKTAVKRSCCTQKSIKTMQ